jgi:hypothetical protein
MDDTLPIDDDWIVDGNYVSDNHSVSDREWIYTASGQSFANMDRHYRRRKHH